MKYVVIKRNVYNCIGESRNFRLGGGGGGIVEFLGSAGDCFDVLSNITYACYAVKSYKIHTHPSNKKNGGGGVGTLVMDPPLHCISHVKF